MTIAARAIFEQRGAFIALIPDWGKAINLHAGVIPNSLIDLHAAFAEWIEANEPGLGHGDACIQLITPRRWIKAIRAVFYRAHFQADHKRNIIMLNQKVLPKTPMPEQRYAVCEACRQPCRVYAKTRTPVATGELTALLKALDDEAKAEIGEIRPTTPALAYSGRKK